MNTQVGSCLTANTTFFPRGAWPPATSPPAQAGAAAATTLAFNLGLPVHDVDCVGRGPREERLVQRVLGPRRADVPLC